MLLLVFGGVGSEGGQAGFTCSLVLRGYLELSMWLYYNKIVWSSVRWRASVKREISDVLYMHVHYLFQICLSASLMFA